MGLLLLNSELAKTHVLQYMCMHFPVQCPCSLICDVQCGLTSARICKRLRSPGIDSKESILPAYLQPGPLKRLTNSGSANYYGCHFIGKTVQFLFYFLSEFFYHFYISFRQGSLQSVKQPSKQIRTGNSLKYLSCLSLQSLGMQYTGKKVSHFPVPSRDVTNQTPGQGQFGW